MADRGHAGQRALIRPAHAKAVLEDLDPNREILDMLNSTGAGNHPVVVRLFAEIGKKLGYNSGRP